MNAIPLVFNAPKANINVNSVRPINANPNKMNMGGAAGMLGGGGLSNEAQLRQEINTSIVALKREAFSLETLIAQAAQILQDVNKRLSELEEKQGDYVKKADATVASVGGDGKYISAISETDGKINATATDLGNMVPVNSVTSGNMHSVTSNAVNNYIPVTNYANPIADCNDAIKSGLYYFRNPDTAHLPTTADGYLSTAKDGSLYVQSYSENYVNQILQDFYSDGTMWVRSKFNGTWGSWNRVILSTYLQTNVLNVMAFRLIVETPNNVTTYVRIDFIDYNKSIETPLVILQCYTSTYLLTEYNVAKKLTTNAYGLSGISWTSYAEDNNSYMWLRFTNYRRMHLISSCKMALTQRTTTAPSGITFVSPV